MIQIDDHTVFNPVTGEFGYLPIVRKFLSNKRILTDDKPACISWDVENALSVWINDEEVSTQGWFEVHSMEPTLWILKARNEAGWTSPVEIYIDIDRTPPVIHHFTIDRTYAAKGALIQFSWKVEGHTLLEIDNGVGDVTDFVQRFWTLENEGVFTLTAYNYFGYSSQLEASITVFPAPIPDFWRVPMPAFQVWMPLPNIQIKAPHLNFSFPSQLRGMVAAPDNSVVQPEDLKPISLSPFLISNLYEKIKRKLYGQNISKT